MLRAGAIQPQRLRAIDRNREGHVPAICRVHDGHEIAPDTGFVRDAGRREAALGHGVRLRVEAEFERVACGGGHGLWVEY